MSKESKTDVKEGTEKEEEETHRPVRGVLLDTFTGPSGIARLAVLDGSLEGYYRALHCDTIDIVSRRIGTGVYDVVLDDEGLLKLDAEKGTPFISAADSFGDPALVGSLFFCRHDGDGNETDLTEADVKNLEAHLHTAKIELKNGLVQRRAVMTGVDELHVPYTEDGAGTEGNEKKKAVKESEKDEDEDKKEE